MNTMPRITKKLKIIMWIINGLGEKREYARNLLSEGNPDVVILSETKMKRPLIQQEDVGTTEYKAIQIKSTNYARGGLVVLIKQKLKVITAEIVREEHGDDFIHVVLKSRYERSLVGWYNSPNTSRKFFAETLKAIMRRYDVRWLAGDLNARHTRWCKTHDEKRRGA